MSDLAIRVEGLTKRYRIGARRRRFQTLNDRLAEAAAALFRHLRSTFRHSNLQPSNDEFIWALNDVSFEVMQGEVVGIIGRNGAGKSTLLKILCRITAPTAGRAEVFGRVGSLLEVGTGFHPELTGRENVYLNGAILGMRKAEIDRKFDEIVAFAEIEKFLDTPVRRYSSGMAVRLAFAVAAHLEPEILLVDEVLAVGDAAFQRKCLGKMGEVAKEGRTVLFVSHNLAAIQALCQRGIWIDQGRIDSDGESESVIEAYLGRLHVTQEFPSVLRSLNGDIEIQRVVTKDQHGHMTSVFRTGSQITIEIHYVARRPVALPYLWIGITSQFGPLFAANMLLDGIRPERLEGEGRLCCTFTELPLLPQQLYVVRMGGREKDGRSPLFRAAEVTYFRVIGSAKDIGFAGEPAEMVVGSSASVLVPYRWELPDGRTVSVDVLGQANNGNHSWHEDLTAQRESQREGSHGA